MASRIAVLGAGAVAVTCCAGLPAIAAALGGATVAALIGVAGGLVTAVTVGVALLLARSRRRGTRMDSRG
jgi:hypothetical protein